METSTSNIMQGKIAVIVITYNRLNFLKEVIQAVKNQTQKIDEIFVIHNSGTDGTQEWLDAQDGLTVITQPNTGSSGGQYTGFKTAFEAGYDWIWTMDDDVIPASNCLEELIKDFDINTIRTPLRYLPNGEPFLNDCINFNLSNPFKSLWNGIVKKDDLANKYIKANGITFEGPIIHRNIIEKIGFPEKKFFIYGDDTEYFIRAKKAGAVIYLNTSAKIQRKLNNVDSNIFSWKHKYIIRNIIAIDVLHGNVAVRILRPFAYFIKWLYRSKTMEDYKTTFKSFLKGYFYKSEN